MLELMRPQFLQGIKCTCHFLALRKLLTIFYEVLSLLFRWFLFLFIGNEYQEALGALTNPRHQSAKYTRTAVFKIMVIL